jgi:hypothetical protein
VITTLLAEVEDVEGGNERTVFDFKDHGLPVECVFLYAHMAHSFVFGVVADGFFPEPIDDLLEKLTLLGSWKTTHDLIIGFLSRKSCKSWPNRMLLDLRKIGFILFLGNLTRLIIHNI